MEQNNYKKNAVFVSAGKESLHRQLLKGDADFDLHLLIYDDSYDLFCHDTEFISVQSGYKMDMTYRYLKCHPEFLENYEYFFLMDDDIEMGTEEVNKLFGMMRKYNLKIAQPSLVMSYYTYAHTIHHPLCTLRYTNFVEMMIPCFSKEALLQVLPTFKLKTRWCGIEYHWPVLLKSNHEDIAILDAVHAIHTHPNRSWSSQNHREMMEYLKRNNLSWNVEEYASVLAVNFRMEEKLAFDKVRTQSRELREWLYNGGLLQIKKSEAVVIVIFLLLDSILWNDKNRLDVTVKLLGKVKVVLSDKTLDKILLLVDFLTKLNDKGSWPATMTGLKQHLRLLKKEIQEPMEARESPIVRKILGVCSSAIGAAERILPWETM